MLHLSRWSISCQILIRHQLEKVPVILPDGTQANINTYPVNHAEVITYPATGDAALDAEAFRKWQFIRLPEELGGGKRDPSAIRAYSMICLHLWCLWKYWPDDGRKEENVLVMAYV